MSIKRRACLICAVLLTVLFPLAVCANAAAPAVDNNSYNIVNGDLLQWHNLAVAGSIRSQNSGNGIVNYICTTEADPVGNGYISLFTLASYDVPSGFLIAGNSYTFSFYVPSNAEISSPSFSYKNQFGGSVIRIGLGTWDGEVFSPFNNAYMDISADNVESLQGRSHALSFVCPDYNGLEIRAMISFLETRSGNYVYNRYYYFGRGVMLIDNAMKAQVDQYNQIWYGGDPASYTNPYTTESYDVGAAGDTDSIDSGLSQWEAGLGEFGTPLRVSGVFLNSLFSTGGIVTIGVIVLVILMFGVIFRLFGVT